MFKGDLGDLMKQAQKMQESMQRAQQEFLQSEVTGESGGGLVKVTLNGHRDVKRIAIDDSVMKEEKSLLEDLLAAAFNDANQRLEKLQKESLSSIAGGMPLPDGFPFSL